MELSNRDAWAVAHGLVLGTIFLLAFAGGLAGLWSFAWRLPLTDITIQPVTPAAEPPKTGNTDRFSLLFQKPAE